jgi:hypothetical protein
MELSFMLAADYANITNNGKLNVMGIFSSINATKFPIKHPQMYIIAQLRVGPAEYGRNFTLELKLIDEDAINVIASVVTRRTVPTPPPDAPRRIGLNHIVRLNNLEFPQPGTYQFSILVDNDEKGALAIELNPAPTPPEPEDGSTP